jgi:hypothetical protein
MDMWYPQLGVMNAMFSASEQAKRTRSNDDRAALNLQDGALMTGGTGIFAAKY